MHRQKHPPKIRSEVLQKRNLINFEIKNRLFDYVKDIT